MFCDLHLQTRLSLLVLLGHSQIDLEEIKPCTWKTQTIGNSEGNARMESETHTCSRAVSLRTRTLKTRLGTAQPRPRITLSAPCPSPHSSVSLPACIALYPLLHSFMSPAQLRVPTCPVLCPSPRSSVSLPAQLHVPPTALCPPRTKPSLHTLCTNGLPGADRKEAGVPHVHGPCPRHELLRRDPCQGLHTPTSCPAPDQSAQPAQRRAHDTLSQWASPLPQCQDQP